MPVDYCVNCWSRHRMRTDATWDVEGELLCDHCKTQLGYEGHEGRPLKPAIASASLPASRPAPAPENKHRSTKPRDPLTPVPDDSGEGKWSDVVRKCMALSTGGVEEFTADPAIPVPTFANRIQSQLRQGAESGVYRWKIVRLDTGVFVTKLGKRQMLEEESPMRVCSVDGCGKQLIVTNRTGRCAAHHYVKKSDRQNVTKVTNGTNGHAPAKRKGRPTLEKKSDLLALAHCAIESHSPDAVATICVTEPQLDRFWMRLTLDEKAAVFTREMSAE
jgi:hypothetical protein